MVSEPPRPSVVTSSSVETPWKPATSTIRFSASACSIRRGRISTILALVWTVSVTIPAWEPVSETAWWPRSSIAIAHSAAEIRSPVESSMSISRGCGRCETSPARATSWSVVLPIAETTPTTGRPVSCMATSRSATRRILAASATDDPPNFITMTRPAGTALVACEAASMAEVYRAAPVDTPPAGL